MLPRTCTATSNSTSSNEVSACVTGARCLRMNLLFVAFVISVALGAVLSLRVTRAREQPRTRRGPVPGYSVTNGAEFEFSPIAGVDAADWRPELIETFHTPDRTRLILTVVLANQTPPHVTERLLRALASDVRERAQALVSVVFGIKNDEIDAVYLIAPDGLGWTGRDPRYELWFRPSEELGSSPADG